MIMDGKQTADKVLSNLARIVADFDLHPRLAVVVVGDDPASRIYVRNKERACKQTGIDFVKVELPEHTSQALLEYNVWHLVNNPNVHGVIVQLPLPGHLNPNVADNIPCRKDVDGLSMKSRQLFYCGDSSSRKYGYHIPCTPAGVMKLLEEYKVDLHGADVCVIGRSDLVGRPLAHLLERENATVTLCHSHTKNLKYHTLRSDVVITAVGKPGIITPDMITPGTVVIDVGISRVDGKIAGDCDPEVEKVAGLFTPVPGGVGPMTVAMLMKNTIDACMEMQNHDE